MLFSEALVELKESKALIRESWRNEDGSYDKYIVFMKGMQSIWQILIKPTPNAGNWLPIFEDFCAEDWIVV